MRTFTILALAGGLAAAGTAAPATAGDDGGKAVTPRGHVTLAGDTVRVRHLFKGAGEAADKSVGTAPRPGETVTLDAERLYKVGRRHGLGWTYREGARVAVHRTATTVGRQAIREALKDRLADAGVPAGTRFRITRGTPRLTVATTVDTTVRVSGFSLNDDSGRFEATASAGPPGRSGDAVELAGRVRRVTIDSETIKGGVADALRDKGVSDHAELDFNRYQPTMKVPAHRDTSVALRDLDYDAERKRFVARVEAGGEPPAEGLRLAGRVHPTVKVPVVTRRMGRETVIRADDVTMKRVRESDASGDVVTTRDKLVGKAAQRLLQPGEPVSSNAVGAPIAVENGQTVTLVLRRGGMLLTVRGKAVEEGAIGDTIRVMNTMSNNTVEGTVRRNGTVAVKMESGLTG